MSNFVNHHSSISSFEMHKIQEENLRLLEKKYPEEKNLKIQLTYERALSELYNLSQTFEYRNYFHPMLGLSDPNSYPKVLGAWMDKIEGSIKVALLENRIEGLGEYFDAMGSLINFSIKEPHEWETISEVKMYSQGIVTYRPNNEIYKNYCFGFNQDTQHYDTQHYELSFLFDVNLDTHPTDIDPQHANITFAGEYTTGLNEQNGVNSILIFYKIDQERMEHIDFDEFHGNSPHYKKSNRHFLIPYDDIKTVVNQPSNPFQMGRRVKSSASSLNSIKL